MIGHFVVRMPFILNKMCLFMNVTELLSITRNEMLGVSNYIKTKIVYMGSNFYVAILILRHVVHFFLFLSLLRFGSSLKCIVKCIILMVKKIIYI